MVADVCDKPFVDKPPTYITNLKSLWQPQSSKSDALNVYTLGELLITEMKNMTEETKCRLTINAMPYVNVTYFVSEERWA